MLNKEYTETFFVIRTVQDQNKNFVTKFEFMDEKIKLYNQKWERNLDIWKEREVTKQHFNQIWKQLIYQTYHETFSIIFSDIYENDIIWWVKFVSLSDQNGF